VLTGLDQTKMKRGKASSWISLSNCFWGSSDEKTGKVFVYG